MSKYIEPGQLVEFRDGGVRGTVTSVTIGEKGRLTYEVTWWVNGGRTWASNVQPCEIVPAPPPSKTKPKGHGLIA